MLSFADRFIKGSLEKNNPCIVGLDPLLSYVPSFITDAFPTDTLAGAAEAIYAYNQLIIDAIYEIVPMVKPQLAYYELYGSAGIAAFEKTVAYAKRKGLLVLADAKRGDIGSTAAAYANAFLGQAELANRSQSVFDVDAVTVNPYLGEDGILPFIDACQARQKGIFILVKTSNPSSGQFQDMPFQNGNLLYEHVATYIAKKTITNVGEYGYSSIGAVVGATYPAQAVKLRALMPHALFLVPGYGMQGGTAKDVLPCFNEDGTGAIISASRSILLAYQKEAIQTEQTFLSSTKDAAYTMQKEVISALKNR